MEASLRGQLDIFDTAKTRMYDFLASYLPKFELATNLRGTMNKSKHLFL